MKRRTFLKFGALPLLRRAAVQPWLPVARAVGGGATMLRGLVLRQGRWVRFEQAVEIGRPVRFPAGRYIFRCGA